MAEGETTMETTNGTIGLGDAMLLAQKGSQNNDYNMWMNNPLAFKGM